MAFTYQPITLDSTSPDREGTLVFRDGRLLAVLTCLSDMHADLTGKLFLEATFGEMPFVQPPVFESAEHFEEWLLR